MLYNIHVSRPRVSDFREKLEASDIKAAIEFAVRAILEAYLSFSPVPTDQEAIITISSDTGEVLGSWKIILAKPVETPCPTCVGVGGVDSGGVTPWETPISIPCPDCTTKEAIIGNLDKTNGHRPECVCSLCKEPSELEKRKAMDETIAHLLERAKCGCLTLDCVTHGSYRPGDWEIFKRIIDTRKLLPPKQLVERSDVLTPVSGTRVFTTYEANNGED